MKRLAPFCGIAILALVAASPSMTTREHVKKIFSRTDASVTEEYSPAPTASATPYESRIVIPAHNAGTNGGVPCPPTITNVKGELTSEGIVVLKGTCFGSKGKIEIGGFPAEIHVKTLSWDPSTIVAQLPKIAGVDDLTMHVKVDMIDGASAAFDAPFTAALGDPIQLPAHDIVSNACGGALQQGYAECAVGQPKFTIVDGDYGMVGIHFDEAHNTNADVWTFTIPAHWHFYALRMKHTLGSTKTTKINASGPVKTIEVSWEEARTVESYDNSVSYDADYSLIAMVRGPAGMTPP